MASNVALDESTAEEQLTTLDTNKTDPLWTVGEVASTSWLK